MSLLGGDYVPLNGDTGERDREEGEDHHTALTAALLLALSTQSQQMLDWLNQNHPDRMLSLMEFYFFCKLNFIF